MAAAVAGSWWKWHQIMEVGCFQTPRVLFVAVGYYQTVRSWWEAAVVLSQTVRTSGRWQVAGCSQRVSLPVAEAVVACCQKAILPVVVGRVVVRQRVRHPGLVELWYSRIKIPLEPAAAGSWCFQITHQLVVRVAGYFQKIPQPEAAESGYCRRGTRPSRAVAAAAVGADRRETCSSVFLSSASPQRAILSAAVVGCCRTRWSLLASLRILRYNLKKTTMRSTKHVQNGRKKFTKTCRTSRPRTRSVEGSGRRVITVIGTVCFHPCSSPSSTPSSPSFTTHTSGQPPQRRQRRPG